MVMIEKSDVQRDPASLINRTAGFRAYLRLVSVDASHNRFRAYTLTWQPGLFGGGALRRSWGRIGSRERTKETYYDDRASAQPEIDRLLRRRLAHHYFVVDVH
jgi:predicted DNA-binding WGR domain protein